MLFSEADILAALAFGLIVAGALGGLVWALVKFQFARMIAAAFVCMLALFGVYMWANAAPVVPGNIDLDHRPVLVWEDGSFSTEISISVEFDGLEVLIPTVIDGKLVSEEEAIQHYLLTGEHLGKFSSVEECESFAVELHLRQQDFYRDRK